MHIPDSLIRAEFIDAKERFKKRATAPILTVIQAVVTQEFDRLSFRAGARIIRLHYRVCPSVYVEQEQVNA